MFIGKLWTGFKATWKSRKAWPLLLISMDELDRQGRIVMSKNGRPYSKHYLDEARGRIVQDIWDDIPRLATSEYPTQKPLKLLLLRIIEASSNPGALVLDPFCGSGTTLVAAKQLGRRYIGFGQGQQAVDVAKSRLADQHEQIFEEAAD